MERTLSIEEKIKKAEGIYNRRNVHTSQSNIYDNKTTRDFRFLNKAIIQLIVCVLIYLSSYIIINNQYVFSEDFKNKLNEIMQYDIEIKKMSEFINSQLQNFKFNLNSETKNQNQTENNTQNQNTQESSSVETVAEADNNTTQETQEEKDIREIKERIKFIVPVVGEITSKFGVRTPTTSTVPVNHTGIDIAAKTGTEIIAATNGKVILNSDEGDYRKTSKSISRRY